MSPLNLMKPISKAEMRIAKKCGWRNMDDIPVRKNIIPEDFVGNAKLVSEPLTIGTRLNRANFEVLETIMGNDKLSKSPFIKTNLTELLELGQTQKNKRLLKVLLTPENIDKIETQRRLVQRNPKEYIKDRDVINYIKTPAGLNSLFSDINILKAAAVLDGKTLDTLFKMDITEGKGKKILDTLGNMEESKLNLVKNLTRNSGNPEDALDYIKFETDLNQSK